MDKELKDKWVEALRSGRYQQQRDAVLHNEHGYCCLGVLHHVVTGEEPKRYWGESLSDCQRPKVVEQIDSEAGHISVLTDMNDRKGKSFAEIADWIEANL